MPTINKLAILSGTLGATASLIAKLALSPTSPVPTFVHSMCLNFIPDTSSDAPGNFVFSGLDTCSLVALASRGVCLLVMIGLNAVMISSFLDGMNESGSVAGTSLATAANFSCSALYGAIFFQEYVSITWYFGAALIGVGMWLLSSVSLVES